MSEPRKLKVILTEVAAKFGVTKARVWATVRRASSGMGRGWNSWSYVQRSASVEERKAFNLPEPSVVLTLASPDRPCFVIYPSSYTDKDGNTQSTVCASSFDYLRSVGISRLSPSDIPVAVRPNFLGEDDQEPLEP